MRLYLITVFVSEQKEKSKLPKPLNLRKQMSKTITRGCVRQSCLHLVCEVLKVAGICSTK